MMLEGILPVLPTLFDDENRIDSEALRSVVRYALDAGAHGIVFPGVASEYNYLTIAERGELMSIVSEEVAERVPIVGGASASTTTDVIAAGSHALEHGIDHLMIMAPSSLGQDLGKQIDFFGTISESLTGAKIILQNAPSPIGAGLDAESMIKIIQANPAVTYAKEETLPSGPAITALAGSDLPQLKGVLGGGGARYLIDELTRGACGAIPAVELTDLHVAIYESHKKGDHSRARYLYQATLPLLVCQAVYRMRLTKYVLERRGIVSRLRVRAPLPQMDAIACQDVDAMLADLQAVMP